MLTDAVNAMSSNRPGRLNAKSTVSRFCCELGRRHDVGNNDILARSSQPERSAERVRREEECVAENGAEVSLGSIRNLLRLRVLNPAGLLWAWCCQSLDSCKRKGHRPEGCLCG